MLGQDFEDEVRSRSVFELACNPIGYFGKMNSTLGSVVPLAMFSSAYGRVFSLVKQTEEKKCSTFFVLCQLPAACLS